MKYKNFIDIRQLLQEAISRFNSLWQYVGFF